MQIVDVTSAVLKSYEYPNGGWVLVRVKTEGGIEGVGECFVPDADGKGAFAARDVIDNSLKRVVIGQDVLATEQFQDLGGGKLLLVELRGLEPLTPCLQSRCSPS